MSAISDYAAKVTAFLDRQDTAITGVSGDVDFLVAEIKRLQETAGQITPEDQAILDGIQARAEAAATKLEALDALTPPPTPA
jgi:hypothetical protein